MNKKYTHPLSQACLLKTGDVLMVSYSGEKEDYDVVDIFAND